MNKNPYQVLGVDENATDEQIKTAYRELAKKYHPDSYQDSPLRDLATEKMKEINEAYDEIQRLRKEGARYRDPGVGYSSGYSNANVHTDFPDVRRLIQEGRIDDALTILGGVPTSNRNAEWYFLSGMVYYRKGWTDQAYSSFKTACDRDPGNPEFRGVFNRMNQQRTYSGGGSYNRSSGTGGCSGCDMCTGLLCADCCCECMGGDLIRCC